MTVQIGIDAGGTLTKIALRPEAGAELRLLKFPSTDIERTAAWINREAPDAKVAVAGGKSGLLRTALGQREASVVAEFDATCAGAAWLLERRGHRPASFLLTNVGTGTSIHLVTADGHERVGGSGVGGGTILGLAKLLGAGGGFEETAELARSGDRARVDLRVSHIYAGVTPPIPGDLTASNFGNVVHQREGTITLSDALASVIGLVGETVTTVSVHAARSKNVTDIVYIGSTFLHNPLLADIVNRYTRLRGGEPRVLPDGEFSGAVGALLSLN